jgi:hypothetical protein
MLGGVALGGVALIASGLRGKRERRAGPQEFTSFHETRISYA